MMFGPGDALALITLVIHLVGALDRRSGASAEIIHLRNYLESFKGTISCISGLLKRVEPPTNTAEYTTARLIDKHLNNCIQLLDDFLMSFGEYSSAFIDKQVTKSNFGQVLFRKLWWAVFKRRDAAILERRLDGYHKQIMVLLEVLIYSKMAPKIDFSPKVDSDSDAVRVIDFMGNNLNMPWQLCSSWPKFLQMMLIYHSDLPGKRNIEKEDFTVFSPSNKAIKGSEWNDLVAPGIQITLAVNILWSSTSDHMDCPRCRGTLELYELKTFVQSRTCATCGCNLHLSTMQEFKGIRGDGDFEPSTGFSFQNVHIFMDFVIHKVDDHHYTSYSPTNFAQSTTLDNGIQSQITSPLGPPCFLDRLLALFRMKSRQHQKYHNVGIGDHRKSMDLNCVSSPQIRFQLNAASVAWY